MLLNALPSSVHEPWLRLEKTQETTINHIQHLNKARAVSVGERRQAQ